ncbi:MAG: ATP-dependent helicase UvrD/PcrA [Chloroflexota bacterium]|nr:ATP-dependent helicase UvrD/PcrA [Chloroflexota bacterium]
MALHPAVTERLARLAPDQRAAATAPPGPVLCVAPAGSGKTTTLVARVCWLVASGADPASITAVTFNKRAAEELGERLALALEPLEPAVVPRVRTFHALGREILSEAGVSVRNLTDRADVLRALNGGRSIPASEMRRLDDGFSRLKLDAGLDAAGVERRLGEANPAADVDADMLHRFIAYERWLADRDALDFDDLVRRALAVLHDDASALAGWRARCATLLVDEVQDVDRSQLDLAVLLAGDRRDIFLVGDDDQTIYAWRLANVRRVLDLAGALPGLRRVDLVTNYRCPGPVVERAVRLISANRERFAKSIRAREGAAGTLALAPDSGDDLDRARRLLATWLPAEPGVHAVLARTNAELAPYAAVAVERGIPYRAAEDGLLLDDPGLDQLLAMLPPGERPSIALARMDARRNRLTRSLCGWALPYASVADLRAAIATARQQRAGLRQDDAQLILATAHGTKGLEFDHVAVIGMDEHVFPSRRTLDEADDPHRALEEERRLAYVAWTRARKSLLLVHDPTAPSVFMREAFTPAEIAL